MTKPHVMVVADFRSPHALAWVVRLGQMEFKVRGVSSRSLTREQHAQASRALRGQLVHVADDAISRYRARLTHGRMLETARQVMRGGRNHPAEVVAASRARPEGTGALELRLELQIASSLSSAIRRHVKHGEVVHALRIPFEGIAASEVSDTNAVAVSVWGQDLVRQAPAHKVLAARTRETLSAVRGLHADCERDLKLARAWGLSEVVPQLLAAGTMGPDEVFRIPPPGRRNIIFCPRGPGTHIEHGIFLEAVERVLRRHPELSAVAANLAGHGPSERFVARSSVADRIHLAGRLSQPQMAAEYGRAIAVVSPSTGDGTPNSLLEAMACGAVVLAADIPSVRPLLESVYEPGLFRLGTSELEEALERVISLSDDAMVETGLRGPRLVTEQWGFEATRDRVLRWYQDVAS